MASIFGESFLSNYLSDFNLSSIADARGKVAVINSLISEQKSGKFSLLKEEEVKSRFINSFFGDVLGFNYGNPGKWLLREEKKTAVDRTKPDAALGFFSVDDIDGDVRAIVEMKNINTDLDAKQKRTGDNRSPVDQAFDYVSKMGGNCKWVIVSNMKEIRFYPSLDRARCQLFLLEELSNEDKIKGLLFLFHKDRFIKEIGVSTTDILFERVKNLPTSLDRPQHILDKMHSTLKGFAGLNYVDPKYIANIQPFNILNDDVWHYKNKLLLTLNPQIYRLLKELRLIEKEVILSDELIDELRDNGVIEGVEKLKESFAFLRQCGIEKIRAIKDYQSIEDRNRNTIGFSIRHSMGSDNENDSITLDISAPKFEIVCDCLICNYRNFEHAKLVNKMKTSVGDEDFDTLEFAYGNYLLATDNFRAAYLTYKRIERKTKGVEGKAVEYFLAKKNIKNLSKDLLFHYASNNATMRNDVKATDLDKVIYDEVEFEVSRLVKNYLVEIKEDGLIYEVQDEIDDSFH